MGITTDGLSYWQAETEDIELLETTIGAFLDQRAEELPHQEAIVYSGYPEFGEALSLRWTYAEYRDRANAVAKSLLALGLKQGEHIAVWAANLPEWPLLQMAAAKVGLVLVTMNPVLRAEEVAYILQQGDVRALFFMARVRDHDCLATIRALTTPGARNGEVTSERLPLLHFVSLVGAPPAALLEQESWRPILLRELVEAGATISTAALVERQAAVSPSDPALLLYTSGTTGFPKGALLTHQGVLNNALGQMRRLAVVQTDRFCVPLPFFHTMGCVLGVLGALAAGGTLHPLLAFDPLKAMQMISRERCTGLAAVPTMLLAILQHPQFGDYDFSSLRTVGSGGAPVPVALMEQVKARIGADVAIGFGQTEASCVITLTTPDDPFELKAATVGIPLPHVAVKIIDPASGAIVPCGQRGELCLRGYLAMQGYYEMPERTAEAIDSEGWLHTGDLAARMSPFGRAFALDMPGFGQAEKPEHFDYTVDGYARHLASALTELGIRRVHLVLHDFGGAWGLAWAVAHPDSFASVTLINTGVLLDYHWHYLARIWRTPVLGEVFQATATRPAFHLLLKHGNPRGLPAAYVNQMYDTYDRGTRRAVLKLYRATAHPAQLSQAWANALRPLDRPALVVWGKHDPYLPVQLAYRQQEVFPTALVVVLEQSGHWPFADDPAGVAEIVVPFLRHMLDG